MNQRNIKSYVVALSLVALALVSTAFAAQTEKVEGFIKARNGETLILQIAGSPDRIVLLTDNTQVGQVQGLLKARRKEMSMAALIPGLAVKVEGTSNNQNQLVAKSISFKGDDLKRAQSIEAGMHETGVQVEQNKEDIQKHNAELQNQQKDIAANKAAVDAAVARFGQLDDYYIFDEATVYFDNGKVNVDPQYHSQLLALAEKAKAINGYMVEVRGYASATGSAALNQKLSEERAGEVVNILIQQGHIPLTRMLAPGAMGEADQVGDSPQTETGQAKNRRVVVRVLQNKAIAGVSNSSSVAGLQ